jgi:hypothetical protein
MRRLLPFSKTNFKRLTLARHRNMFKIEAAPKSVFIAGAVYTRNGGLT